MYTKLNLSFSSYLIKIAFYNLGINSIQIKNQENFKYLVSDRNFVECLAE